MQTKRMTAAWLDLVPTRWKGQCVSAVLICVDGWDYLDIDQVQPTCQGHSSTRSFWSRHADCWELCEVFSYDRLSISSLCSRPVDSSALGSHRKNKSHAERWTQLNHLSATWRRKLDALLVAAANILEWQWPVVDRKTGRTACQMNPISMNAA